MTTQAKQKKQVKHNAKLPKIPSDKSMKQFLVKEIARSIYYAEVFLAEEKRWEKEHYSAANPDDPSCVHFRALNQTRNSIRTQKAYLHKLRHLQKILKTLPDHILTEDAAEGIRVMFGEKR